VVPGWAAFDAAAMVAKGESCEPPFESLPFGETYIAEDM
jgi:hypothetical protein